MAAFYLDLFDLQLGETFADMMLDASSAENIVHPHLQEAIDSLDGLCACLSAGS